MSAPRVAGYQLASAVVAVEASDMDVLEWLDEVLRPWLTAPADCRGAYRVRLVQSERDLRELERLSASRPALERVCFALDSSLLRFPSWARDGEIVLRDADRECFYRVRGGEVEIVAPPGALPPRVGVMRVVREIACAHVRGDPGTIELHGAAIAIDGRAALVLGPKRAGKTSLLLHLLGTGCAEFVANDRVFVREAGGAHTVLGVPTLVQVRPDTVEMFPRLRHGLPPGRRWALASLREAALQRHDLPQVADPDAPLGLTPAQFCRQVGARPTPSARLVAVLLPEVQPAAEGWDLERVPAEIAAERVRANVHGSPCWPRPPSVFEELVDRPDRSRSDAGVLSERVVASVPVYRCTLGRATQDDSRGALGLLEQLGLIRDDSSLPAVGSSAEPPHSGSITP